MATAASKPAASAVALYPEHTVKMATAANLPVAARMESFALVHLLAAQRAKRCVASFVSLRVRSAVSQVSATRARSALQTESALPEAHPVEAAVAPQAVLLVVPQEVLVA